MHVLKLSIVVHGDQPRRQKIYNKLKKNKNKNKKIGKQVRQQDAYLAIRPAYPWWCCPRAAKGDKTSATSVSTQVIFGVDLLTFRPDIAYKRPNWGKKQNCTSYVHRIESGRPIRIRIESGSFACPDQKATYAACKPVFLAVTEI